MEIKLSKEAMDCLIGINEKLEKMLKELVHANEMTHELLEDIYKIKGIPNAH